MAPFPGARWLGSMRSLGRLPAQVWDDDLWQLRPPLLRISAMPWALALEPSQPRNSLATVWFRFTRHRRRKRPCQIASNYRRLYGHLAGQPARQA